MWRGSPGARPVVRLPADARPGSARARNAVAWVRRSAALAEQCEGARTPPLLGGDASDPLSRREREIVALTVAGESAPAIAAALFLSERTVESHLARVYVKLGVHSKPELARRAAQLGLAPGSP